MSVTQGAVDAGNARFWDERKVREVGLRYGTLGVADR